MHWKGRQMFGGRPSGIVQMMGGGMTPYPTHVMPDGSVMRGAVHGQGYQDGGVLPELFEEGDSDINNALNNMASVSNPEVPDMPASNGMALPGGDMVAEEMTMDQGPGYEEDVMQLKERFKNEIRSYVSQAGTTDLQSYLQKMDVVYSNQLNKIKKKHNVTEALPGDALITEDFLAELSSGSEMPSYEHGGEVHQPDLDARFGVGQMSLKDWEGLNDEQRSIIGRKLILAKLERDRMTSKTGLDRSVLDSLMQERRENAKRLGAAARANYGSTSSRASQHYADARTTGEATEAMAMDKILADQISQEQALLGAQTRATGKGIGGIDIDFNAAESERFTLGNLLKEEQEQEQIDALWLAIQKANNYKKFGESIGRHLTSTGGKLPTLLKDKRVYTNPITKGSEQGTLLDFYELVMQVKTDEDGKTLKDIDLARRHNELLNKWPTFQLYAG